MEVTDPASSPSVGEVGATPSYPFCGNQHYLRNEQ